MKTEPLGLANPDDCTAKQCRKLGIVVGDTIVGMHPGLGGRWEEARMKLLWVGKACAAWSVQQRGNVRPQWGPAQEMTTWNLGFRAWRRVVKD